MTIYDNKNEFSAELAAKLISGAIDSDGNADTCAEVLRIMGIAYRSALAYCQEIQTSDNANKWLARPPWPGGAILSVDMQRCERLLEIDPEGGTFAGWLNHSSTTFEDQTFTREEIGRWLGAVSIKSSYPFTAVPEHKESAEQRRARWLGWYGKGERGAVQAVFERELKQNPKADRSFIGKQIKMAEEERATAQRGGAWTSQLVQDGKRKD